MASRSSRGVLLVAALAAVALLIVALIAAVGSLNPFGSETKDRSGPVLLKSLEDLSQYRAASANMQVVVDVEQDDKLLPSFIRGERTLFVAAGTVDAAVDFSGLSKDAGAVAGVVLGRFVEAPSSLPDVVTIAGTVLAASSAALLGLAWPGGRWLRRPELGLAGKALALHLTFVPGVLLAASLAGLAIPPAL